MTKRKMVSLVLSVLLIIAVPLTGCGQKSENKTDAQTTKKAIKINIGGGQAVETTPWLKDFTLFFIPEVTKRAAEIGYQVDFQQAWGGSVVKSAESLEAVQNRILDISFILVSAYASQLPMHSFSYYLPFGPDDPIMVAKAAEKVMNDIPVMKDAFKQYKQKYLCFTTLQSYGLASKTSITTVAGFKGKKVGGLPTLHYYPQAINAVPVATDASNMYTNLQTGVIDANIMLPQSVLGAKVYEVAPYFIQVPIGSCIPVFFTINQEFFDGLPKEIQAIIEKVSVEYNTHAATVSKSSMQDDLKKWQDNKGTLVPFPAAETEKWAAAISGDFIVTRLKTANEKGLPGKQIMETYIKALQDAGFKLPREWKLQ